MSNRQKDSKSLINIAIYQLMHHQSYEEINVKDICNKANISRMSFYRNYSNKDDIFVSFCDERFQEFFNLFKKIENPTITILSEQILNYIYKYRKQIKILSKINKLNLLLTQFENYFAYIFKVSNSKYIEEFKTNPLSVSFYSGGLFNIVRQWCHNDFKDSVDVLIKNLNLIFEAYKSSSN